MKYIALLTVFLASLSQAQNFESVENLKITTKNLVKISYETNNINQVVLNIDYSSAGIIHRVSGNATLTSIWSHEYLEECIQNYGKKLYSIVRAGDSNNCSLIFSFVNLSGTQSIAEIAGFMDAIKNNEFEDIAASGANISNHQEVEGGDAHSNNSSLAGSAAAGFGKKNLSISAALASGASSAESSTNHNSQRIDNIAVNTVKNCTRMTPFARLQITDDKIRTISLNWSSQLIRCP